MSGQWKPGDVAMYEYLSSGRLMALRVKGGNSNLGGDCPVSEHGVADHWHLSNGGWTLGTSESIRGPLLVIDAEDRDQVEALCSAHEWYGKAPELITHMQAALRSLLPTPTPEEPTGLGAVVRNANGELFIRTTKHDFPWVNARRPETNAFHWTEHQSLDGAPPVEVLSEGVQP